MAEVKIKNVEPLLAACIERERATISDLNKDIDRLYSYLYENDLGGKVAGPTIGLFYSESGGKMVSCAPIKEVIPVEDDIKICTLPAIKCISLLHRGSYKTIEDSFNKLKEYQKSNNLIWLFPVREIYIQTGGDENDYVTEIQVPIEEIK